jgi:hypothetical protein
MMTVKIICSVSTSVTIIDSGYRGVNNSTRGGGNLLGRHSCELAEMDLVAASEMN